MNHHAATAIVTGMGMLFLIPTLGLALFIAWVISLVDVIKSDFKEKNDKFVWIFLILVFPPITVPLYLIVGRTKKETKGILGTRSVEIKEPMKSVNNQIKRLLAVLSG